MNLHVQNNHKKSIMLKQILLLILLSCSDLSAMLSNSAFSQAPVHMANGTCLAHRAANAHPITRKPQSTSTKFVADINDDERNEQEMLVNKCLQWAARGFLAEDCNLPQQDDFGFTDYILSRIDPIYIKEPEKFLVASVEGLGNNEIFAYIEKTFGAECTIKAVRSIIEKGQHKSLKKILDKSVNMKSMRPLLVPTAIRAFSNTDDKETTAQRLAIFNMVLGHAEVKDVPSQFELALHGIPSNVQDEIKRLLNEKLYPPRVCMSEHAGETPLHRAARDHESEAVLYILSEWSGPLPKVAEFPEDDLMWCKRSQGFMEQTQNPSCIRGIRRFADHMEYLNAHIDERLALATKLRKAQNCRGLTPVEVAIDSFGGDDAISYRTTLAEHEAILNFLYPLWSSTRGPLIARIQRNLKERGVVSDNKKVPVASEQEDCLDA